MKAIYKIFAFIGGIGVLIGIGASPSDAKNINDLSLKISSIHEQSPLYLEHAITRFTGEYSQLAYHYSHQSHVSHRSHQSHYSHYSYS